VVLFELMPSDVQWQVIGRLSEGFGNIQFIHGNPLLHLAYGSIHTAAQVLVLNCSTRDASATGAFDAAVIVISRSIESRHPSLFLLAEVAEGNSIRFLGTGRASDIDSQHSAPFALDYMFRPRFAAGRVFAVSVLDSLVARAFSNPAVLAVIKLMISSSNKSAKIYLCRAATSLLQQALRRLVTHLLTRNILTMGHLSRRRPSQRAPAVRVHESAAQHASSDSDDRYSCSPTSSRSPAFFPTARTTARSAASATGAARSEWRRHKTVAHHQQFQPSDVIKPRGVVILFCFMQSAMVRARRATWQTATRASRETFDAFR
jgi:hypothetical protein